MMKYLKPVYPQQFSLANLDMTDEYSVWDNSQKKFLRAKTTQTLITRNGEAMPFSNTAFLKTPVFTDLFPGKSRKYSKVMNVLVGGEPCRFGMPKQVFDGITTSIESMNALGKSAVELVFKLDRTGTGFQTRYNVSVCGQCVPPTQSVLDAFKTTILLPEAPNALECEIVDKMVELRRQEGGKEKFLKQYLVAVLEANSCNIAHADRLWSEITKKEMADFKPNGV